MRYKNSDDNRYRVQFMRSTEELMDQLTVKEFISYLEENAEFEDYTVEYIDKKCVKCRAYDLTEENSKLHKEFLVTEDGRVFYWRSLISKIELVDAEEEKQEVSKMVIKRLKGAKFGTDRIARVVTGYALYEEGKCSVSYRGEENLWGNIWTWLDKVNILAKGQNEVFVHEIGATVADDTTTGYKSLGYHWSHSNGYQSAFGIDPEHPELLIPTEASGSDVFTGNFVWQNYTYNGFLVARLGGIWDSGSGCGGFCWSLDDASSSRGRTIGGRLVYVPQAA